MIHIRKIAVILIIIGVLVGVSPLIGQYYTKYQEQKMIDEWLSSEDAPLVEQFTEVDPEEGYSQLQQAFESESGETEGANGEAAEGVASGDASGAAGAAEGANGDNASESSSQSGAISSDQADAAAKPVSEASKQTVLGIIRIKKIKVVAPIVEGVRSSNLKAAVGHIPGTAGLGKPGNCALAGHRSYTFGKFFNRLDELIIGDEISITTKKEDLNYEVYKILTVTPEDVSVLKGSKDDTIITLITCTPIYVASHRLIVQAKLVGRTLKEP